MVGRRLRCLCRQLRCHALPDMLNLRPGEVQAEVHEEGTDAFLGRRMAASRIRNNIVLCQLLPLSCLCQGILLCIWMLFTCRMSQWHLFSQLCMSLPGFEAATAARVRCAAGFWCFCIYDFCLLHVHVLKFWSTYHKHTWLSYWQAHPTFWLYIQDVYAGLCLKCQAVRMLVQER